MVREVPFKFANLPKDLEGLRLVQLSDMHMGAFYTAADLARAVDAANGLRADLMLVTGDLITDRYDPLDRCLLELKRLRAASGVWGCLGNHEMRSKVQNYTTQKAAAMGMRFLRQEVEMLPFGGAKLNLVGVDHQRRDRPYLEHTAELVAPGAFNVLLSHNPDVFPVAARQRFDLTISGHTHGGQINIDLLGSNLNIADLVTPFTKGALSDRSILAVCEFRPWHNRSSGSFRIAARSNADNPVQILILSDIHSNWHALQAVIDHAKGGYGQIVCCGDLVGYNANPDRVTQWVRENCATTIRGNHDKVVAGIEDLEWFNDVAQVAARWTIARHGRGTTGVLARPDKRSFDYRALPYVAWFGERRRRVRDDKPPRLGRISERFELPLAFFGHTHLQGGFFAKGTRVGGLAQVAAGDSERTIELEPDWLYMVNPGSVGQPRDGDPRAAYAIYDSDRKLVTLRRVEYPVAKAALEIQAGGPTRGARHSSLPWVLKRARCLPADRPSRIDVCAGARWPPLPRVPIAHRRRLA